MKMRLIKKLRRPVLPKYELEKEYEVRRFNTKYYVVKFNDSREDLLPHHLVKYHFQREDSNEATAS